ncbi:CaiB/BaiF CoA transferase family protein [Actinophytocola sp.]|uniref:CaiB/BaiF CoA transferase family protein n=1 Tax=Actinophytocola sp. TaxID=1872138 RepID=UPI003D6B08E7
MAADNTRPVLKGLRILDIAHQYSAALSAGLLADLGADVVAVEHPSRPTAARTMIPRKDGESLWWKVMQRNKRLVTLDLSTERGREILLELAPHFDVIVENFRPGTLERWHLGPADLEAAGLNVVLLRVSGFGQTGPYRDRPGFGTIAEAFSGFAHLNGETTGPPTFPSTTLADGVAGTFGALGILAAMWNRATGDAAGVQVIDLALFEGLFRLIPIQIPTVDQLGVAPIRPGNKLTSHGALRNLYTSRDKRNFCVSAVGTDTIRRILVAASASELVERLDGGAMFDTNENVITFLEKCDERVDAWASALDYADISRALAESGAVYQEIYSAEEIYRDPHYQARGDLVSAPDSKLGPIMMQGVVPKFVGREHVVSHAGPARGTHTAEVYRDLLGMSESELDALREQGVI